jgi:predicted DNA binding protein
MAVVRLRFEIPHDFAMYGFSRAHPECVLNVLAAQTLSPRRLVANLEIVCPEGQDYTAEISRLRGIESAARLGPAGHRTRYQVILREPTYISLANEHESLLRFPRTVQDGVYTLEVAARVSQLRALVEGLRRISPRVEVLRFGRDLMHTCPPTLSHRQYALLQMALSAGYFDVPRRITLSRLATRLHRSKSSLSQSLALVEKILAESSVSVHA